MTIFLKPFRKVCLTLNIIDDPRFNIFCQFWHIRCHQGLNQFNPWLIFDMFKRIFGLFKSLTFSWCHDIQHNYVRGNDIQHNGTDTLRLMTLHQRHFKGFSIPILFILWPFPALLTVERSCMMLKALKNSKETGKGDLIEAQITTCSTVKRT